MERVKCQSLSQNEEQLTEFSRAACLLKLPEDVPRVGAKGISKKIVAPSDPSHVG
jgi:hypothetical protein